MAQLRQRPRRPALFSPQANHPRERLAARNRLDLPHRRCLYSPARPPHRIRSHAPLCRWRPLLATPLGRILALDPSTGKLNWAYDAKVQKDAGYGDFANRGVSLWTSRSGERRIFLAAIDGRLIAVDARTGHPVESFGDNGVVHLRTVFASRRATFLLSSRPRLPPSQVTRSSSARPLPITARPTCLAAKSAASTPSLASSSGPGTRWPSPRAPAAPTPGPSSPPIPRAISSLFPRAPPAPTTTAASALATTASPTPSSPSRADTGKLAWYFQTIHHDLWDYDVASPHPLRCPP